MPDLIAVLDSQNGTSIGTQDYRYGLRVTVLGIACDPRWTTAKGLDIGGPEAFGCVTRRKVQTNIELIILHRMKTNYTPIAEYLAPRSVIDDFRQD